MVHHTFQVIKLRQTTQVSTNFVHLASKIFIKIYEFAESTIFLESYKFYFILTLTCVCIIAIWVFSKSWDTTGSVVSNYITPYATIQFSNLFNKMWSIQFGVSDVLNNFL